MTDRIEELIGKIAELTNAVKEHPKSDPTFDIKGVTEKFETLLSEYRTALVDNTPARAGAYEDPKINKAVEAYEGKYKNELKGIVYDGEYRVGNWRMRGCDLLLAKSILTKANQLKTQGVQFPGFDKLKPVSADLELAVKTMTATGAGIGDELVPTGMATELWNDFFSASLIVADLPGQLMPTDPFDIPLTLGDTTWRKGGAGTAVAATNLTTAKSTLTSTEQITEVDWVYDLDEDSIVAVMPALRSRLTLSGGEQMDAFAINADATATATGNINLDDDTPASDAYYLSVGQDGIRHLYIVDNSGQAGAGGGVALTDAVMTTCLNKLDKYGLNIENLRIVPGVATYLSMLGLTNVATMEKYGQLATIVKGELARYRGIPVLPSASMPKTEADGKACKTAANNTLGQLAVYNRNMWQVGFRRGLTIEVDRNIQTRQLYMVVSFRIALAAFGTRSTVKHTAGVINLLV